MKKTKMPANEYKWDKKQEIYVPKGSQLAYTIFISERKQELHKEQEKMEESKRLSSKQIARKLKSEWKHLDHDVKVKYLDMVDKDKKRFDLQRKEMEDKGYFTLTTGVKSTDIPLPDEILVKRRSTTPVKQEVSKKPAKKK